MIGEDDLSEEDRTAIYALEEALSAALDVEPSENFVALVRERVTKERNRPPRRYAPALLVTLATAAALVLVVRPFLVPRHSDGLPEAAVATMPSTAGLRPPKEAAEQHLSEEMPHRVSHQGELKVLIDHRAVAALRHYIQMGPRKGSIARDLEARVTAMELPRVNDEPLESAPTTEDLPRISVDTDFPRLERSTL